MATMSRMYGEIEFMYRKGIAPAVIARELELELTFVHDVIDAFAAEWEANMYDEAVYS